MTENTSPAYLRAQRDTHPPDSPQWAAYQGALEAVDPGERHRRRQELGQTLPSTAKDAAAAISEANAALGRPQAEAERVPCDHCDGRGHPWDDPSARCLVCEGLGEIAPDLAETRRRLRQTADVVDAITGGPKTSTGWQAPPPTHVEVDGVKVAETRHIDDEPQRAVGYVTDPVTGEAHRIDVLAADIAHLEARRIELAGELERVETLLEPKRFLFRQGIEVGGRLELENGGAVTVVPGRPGPQRVNRKAAQEHATALVDLGVGRMEWTATADELRKMAAPIIAAGLPYQRILPDPSPGQPTVVVVWPDDAQAAA